MRSCAISHSFSSRPRVGIVQHTGILRESGLAIAISIIVSSVLAMAVTALVFERLGRLPYRADDLSPTDTL
jgi:putative effector of murein hydrolase LrgA (UPF0299 family)